MLAFGLEYGVKRRFFSKKQRFGLRDINTGEFVLEPVYVRVLVYDGNEVVAQRVGGKVERYTLKIIEGKTYLGDKTAKYFYKRGKKIEYFFLVPLYDRNIPARFTI